MSNGTTQLERLEEAVNDHGEVHAYLTDIGEKDIRLGTASFDHDANVLTVDDGQTTHHVNGADIVYWYKPMEF